MFDHKILEKLETQFEFHDLKNTKMLFQFFVLYITHKFFKITLICIFGQTQFLSRSEATSPSCDNDACGHK